jgi:hypothetical protein
VWPLRRTSVDGRSDAVPRAFDACASTASPASHEVRLAAERCMSAGPRYVGLPAVPARRCFQRSGRFSRPTVPRNSRHGFILSCVSVLFGVPSPAYRASPCGSAPSCRGLFPLRGVTAWRPLARRIPSLRYVPSPGFLNLSTACSATRLCGLVSSHSHVQGFRSGVCPRLAAAPTRRRPCLLALAAAALTGCPAATPRRLDFEALIRGAIRSSSVGG